MSSARLQQRIHPRLRKDAEMILAAQGIKPSQAIILFYAEIKRRGGLPFTLTPVEPQEIPNARLAREVAEARKGNGVHAFRTTKELFTSLKKL